jgi:hypothetical protein
MRRERRFDKMTDSNWVQPPPPEPSPRGRAGMAVLGAVAGVAAGAAITWGVVSANATTTPATVANSGGAASAVRPGFPDHGGALGSSGTVTAVGASSVTIKTSSGTKTYKVTSSSDIDKNGESQLSDLKVGDAVRFDTDTVSGATVIDHLHAGKEALDRPTG